MSTEGSSLASWDVSTLYHFVLSFILETMTLVSNYLSATFESRYSTTISPAGGHEKVYASVWDSSHPTRRCLRSFLRLGLICCINMTRSSNARTPLPTFQLGVILFIQAAEPLTNSVIFPFVNQIRTRKRSHER